jgi:hypothetical protein
MKWLSAAWHLVTRYTPFKSWIRPMFVMAKILSGLTLMTRLERIKPCNIPLGIPKTHYSGFSLMFLNRKHLNA